MALTKVGKGGLDKGSIKDQTNLGAEAADTDEFLLYDASADDLKAIQSQNVVGPGIITNKSALGAGAATGDQILIYDVSAGVLKKVTQTNFLNFPTVTSVSPTNLLSGDGTGNYTIVITGSGFTGATAKLLKSDNSTEVAFDSQTVDSDTQITGTIAKSSLSSDDDSFGIRVTAGSGLQSQLNQQISLDASPVFSTAAGLLGAITDSARSGVSFTVAAADPESGGDVVYTLESGSIPSGLSFASTSSGAVISGTANAVGSDTTSTFTIRAKDAASNYSDRQFSISVLAPVYTSFTSSGTFSVPSGVSSVNVLVVAGGGAGGIHHAGGGGAGGLIYRPGFPVTPGGSVSVTVGDGAGPEPSPGPTPHGGTRGDNGQDSVFGSLTAKGGGGGGSSGPEPGNGKDGGSGGGGDGPNSGPTGGSATQPNQPGESGNYGFGYPGGGGGTGPQGGGGGGAGAAGQNSGSAGPTVGDGGIGKAYTISDGSTPVYYAGGGGGGAYQAPGQGGAGGQGGGGRGSSTSPPGDSLAQPAISGTANRGGGGGGSDRAVPSGSGGKGIVIVQY